MPIRLGIDQLHVQPDPIPFPAHAPFQDCADAECLADLPRVLRISPVAHDRGTRDHLQIANLGQICQDVVLDAVRKKSVFLTGAQVHKGQHGDRFLNARCRESREEKESSHRRQDKTGKTKQQNIATAMSVARHAAHGEWQIGRGPDTVGRHVIGPGENERDRKPGKQQHDCEAKRPVGQFPSRKHCRSQLDDAPRRDRVSHCHPIHLPTLQLVEEPMHRNSFGRHRVKASPVPLTR